MSSVWMETEDFEKSTEILDAINVLSVHAKLAHNGADDITTYQERERSRKHLSAFLVQMSGKTSTRILHSGDVAWGADARLDDLAQQLTSIQHPSENNGHTSGLAAEILQCLNSESPEDMEQLANLLRELRSLVQQHSHSNVVELFGDI